MMKVDDLLVYPPRRPVEDVLAYFDAHPPKRRDEAEACVREIYRLCAPYGLDPCLVIARTADETGNTTGPEAIYVSSIWDTRLNCGGLGVTDGGDEMMSFADGKASARAMVAHTVTYSTLEFEQGELRPEDDPRYQATVDAGTNDTCVRLSDLEGKWYTNPEGTENTVARGNRVFPAIANQEEGSMSTTDFPFDKVMTTRYLGKLRKPGVVTIHNNGNPSSDRYDEAAFVQSGGGSSGVLYHFAVDDGGVVQIAKMDALGVHAGNVQGNETSIAIEMCEGSDNWNACKEHTAQWLAEIVTNSRGILDYGSWSKADFSLDRVKEHRDWPGANPNCPSRLIQTDGGCEKIVKRAKEIVAAITDGGEEPEPPPSGPDYPEGMDEGIAERLFGTAEGEDGRRYSFNPEGVISNLWLAEGIKTGEYPDLEAVWLYGSGDDDTKKRKYFVFRSGLVIWQPNESSPPKVLK